MGSRGVGAWRPVPHAQPGSATALGQGKPLTNQALPSPRPTVHLNANATQKVGRVPEPVLAAIAARVLQGLAFLHRRRLVHRDIKPANILLSLRGEAKIADFGISAFVDSTIANVRGKDGGGWDLGIGGEGGNDAT